MHPIRLAVQLLLTHSRLCRFIHQSISFEILRGKAMDDREYLVAKCIMVALLLTALPANPTFAKPHANSIVGLDRLSRGTIVVENSAGPNQSRSEGSPTRLVQAGSAGGTIGQTGKSISGGKAAPKQRETRSSHCHVEGRWAWSTGGVAVITGGGAVTKGRRRATWSCKNREVVLVWRHGYTDHLTLSSDSNSMKGKNNYGTTIFAVRKKAE
jgi:hypothetical protein